MKKIIGCIVWVVFAVQVLPVKQVGSLLINNQWQEEIPHTFDSDACKKHEMKHDWIDHPIHFTALSGLTISEYYNSYSVQIPKNHSCEMLVPPPNC